MEIIRTMAAFRGLSAIILLLIIHLHPALSQLPVTECCDLSLMDASRQVTIETDRVLPLGTFSAMRVRLCTKDPVSIQIWTRVSATQFQFKWQTQLTATDQQANEVYSYINLQNNPVTITAGDRLAFYNPSNTSSKIPIPYKMDAINGALYYSALRFTGSQFVNGQQINTDSLKWPRTFSEYLIFCTTVFDCPPMAAVSTTTVSPGSTSQGSASGVCCGPPSGQVSCDPSGSIGDNLNDQNDQVKALEDDINRLLYILNNLINSTVVTGICPDGFIAGVYGVGSCYVIHRDEKIQLAQAAIKCRDNYKAELLKIETSAEDQFIKNTLLQKTGATGIESYWTAGMYNIPLRNWFWYSDNTRTKAPFMYRNWQNGMEPAATSIYDVCSVYTIDVPNSADYWQKNDCTLNNYYICEIPKQCL